MTTYLRVRELGEQQGFNITTLSRKAELAYSTAHALWQGNVAQLNIKTLDRVAHALSLPVSELFGDTEEDAADVAAYNEAKAALASGDEEIIPFEQAMAEIDAERLQPAG